MWVAVALDNLFTVWQRPSWMVQAGEVWRKDTAFGYSIDQSSIYPSIPAYNNAASLRSGKFISCILPRDQQVIFLCLLIAFIPEQNNIDSIINMMRTNQLKLLLSWACWLLLDLNNNNRAHAADEIPAEPCSPCPNPADQYDPALGDRQVDVPGVGVVGCSFVESIVPRVLSEGDRDCTVLQSLGTFCGCPVKQDSCGGLCEGYNKNAMVPDLFGYEDYSGTCEIINSFLESLTEGSDECLSQRFLFSEDCGCEAPEQDPNGGTGSDIFGQAPGDENTGPEPPTVCFDGSPVGFPDKDMSKFFNRSTNPLVQEVAGLVGNSKLTCEMTDNLARSGSLPAETGDAEERYLYAGECGCPPAPNACEFCPSNDMTASEDFFFPLTSIIFSIQMTCAELGRALSQYENTERRCWTAKNFAWLCGCNGGTPWYLGADTERQHKVLAWVPRISGFLSLFGSIYIIQDIWRQKRRGIVLSTYQLLLLGMSFFDISSSLAWMVSTAAIPEYDDDRDSESGVYGAVGTEGTCKAQGFFLELGFVGSTAFTASLTTFYVLSIIYGYRESKMKPLRKYLLAIPSFIAVVLAAAAIPYYQPFYVACLVSNPNTEVDGGDGWTQLIMFSILPVGISILISIANMGMILQFVVKQNRKANRWRFEAHSVRESSQELSVQQKRLANLRGSGKSLTSEQSSISGGSNASPRSRASRSVTSSMPGGRTRVKRNKTEKAVFWQAFWYVVAFLLTWVIYLIGQFKPYFSSDDQSLYSFWIALLLLNPLMGFWNAFVYVKPWSWDWKKIASSLMPYTCSCKIEKKTNSDETASQSTSRKESTKPPVNLVTNNSWGNVDLPASSITNSEIGSQVIYENQPSLYGASGVLESVVEGEPGMETAEFSGEHDMDDVNEEEEYDEDEGSDSVEEADVEVPEQGDTVEKDGLLSEEATDEQVPDSAVVEETEVGELSETYSESGDSNEDDEPAEVFIQDGE